MSPTKYHHFRLGAIAEQTTLVLPLLYIATTTAVRGFLSFLPTLVVGDFFQKSSIFLELYDNFAIIPTAIEMAELEGKPPA
jgi:hypothetical protein